MDGTAQRLVPARWALKGLRLELEGLSLKHLRMVEGLPGVRSWPARQGLGVSLPRPVLATGCGQLLVRTVLPAGQAEALLQRLRWPGKERSPGELLRELYPHQFAGVRFLTRSGQALLGDGMGLGKTTQAAVAAVRAAEAEGGRYPLILVVGPKHTGYVWQRELRAIYGERVAFRWLTGRKPVGDLLALEPGRTTVFFAHYDVVGAWAPLLSSLPLVVAVFDEVHAVRNWSAKRTQGAALAASQAFYRFGLSGTPLVSRVGDLWGVLGAVLGFGTVGKRADFVRTFGGGVWNGYTYEETEPTRVALLREYLQDVYLRRTVEVLEQPLPSFQREAVLVEVSAAVRKRDAELLARLRAQGVRPAALLEGSVSSIRAATAYRKALSTAKVKATAERALAALGAGESVVVFCWQRETARKLAERIERGFDETRRQAVAARGVELGVQSGAPAVRVVEGSMDSRAREAAIEGLQRGGGVLVATYGTLAEGVTLTRASTVILHDLEWTPATLLQAEARCHRIGQRQPVRALWMVADVAVERHIARLLALKARRIAAMGDEAPLGAFEQLGLTERAEAVQLDALLEGWPEVET